MKKLPAARPTGLAAVTGTVERPSLTTPDGLFVYLVAGLLVLVATVGVLFAAVWAGLIG